MIKKAEIGTIIDKPEYYAPGDIVDGRPSLPEGMFGFLLPKQTGVGADVVRRLLLARGINFDQEISGEFGTAGGLWDVLKSRFGFYNGTNQRVYNILYNKNNGIKESSNKGHIKGYFY